MKTRTIVNNTLFLTLSALLTRGLAYLYFLVIARHFTGEQMGIYAVLMTVYLMMELLANLGLDKIVIRDMSGAPAQDRSALFYGSLTLKLTVSGAVYGVSLLAFAGFYPELFAAYGWEACLFLVAVVPVAMARTLESAFTARETMMIPAASQLAERMMIFLFALGVMAGMVGFRLFLLAAPVAACCRALVAGYSYPWRRDPPRWVGGTPLLGLWRESSQMLVLEVMAVMYFRVDIFMLSKMATIRETGIYNVAYKVFDFFIALFSGFVMALFPAMARGETRRRFLLVLATGFLGLGAAVLPLILFRDVLLGVFGAEFIDGGEALVLLLAAVPFVYVNSLLANLAVVGKRMKKLILLGAVLVIVNVSLNAALIPMWGMNGAAWATLLCEALNLCLLFWLLRDLLFASPAIPAAGMGRVEP